MLGRAEQSRAEQSIAEQSRAELAAILATVYTVLWNLTTNNLA
jgi:hypothetical protein